MRLSVPIAALPMYDFPEIAAANDALWGRIAARLKPHGVEAPARLTRSGDPAALWRDPDLFFAQICGYPYAKALSEAVVLIATPEYGFPGCEGASYRSFLVRARDDSRQNLGAFRGAVAAINAPDSNSGMNLFRGSIAPLARRSPFFCKVAVTGSHEESLQAVAGGRADLAAIDCVTFGLLERLRPALVERIAVVAESPASPGLPFVASAHLPNATVDALRDALFAALADQDLGWARDALGLAGARLMTPGDYERVLEIEREAEEVGYPLLA